LVQKPPPSVPQERPEDLTAEQVEERIVELVAARGRKGTDRREQVQQMEWLSRAAKTPAQLVRVLLHMIAAQFDLGHMLGVMPRDMYQAAMNTAERLLQIAKTHPKVVRSAVRDVGVASSALEPADAEALEHVMVDFAALVERLDDELTRAFQGANPHSIEYVERLRDEPRWVEFAGQVQHYYEQQVGDMSQAARVAARRVLHLYYQSSAVHHRMHNLKITREETTVEEEVDPETLFTELTVLVYRHGDERAKAETMLAHVYHLAIENEFSRARDLFLMTHLQENINQQDMALQIMYNRALAQLGLCAFRCGLIAEAHACLADLCSPPQFYDPRTGTSASSLSRIRELLAQNTPALRNSNIGGHASASEQERRRQVPFHMQLSTELLEAVHLTAAMLLEVPVMAAVSARSADWLAGMDMTMHADAVAGGFGQNSSNISAASLLNSLQQQARQASISRAWQHLMRGSIRGQYAGPPENTRDHIVAASKHLLRGDWRTAFQALAGAKVWAMLEPLSCESNENDEIAVGQGSQSATAADVHKTTGTSGEACLDRLQLLMKEAALKAFVLSYAPCCDTFALEPQLVEHFELEPHRIHAILSKMIAQGELPARWHQPSAALIVHHRYTSRLQRIGMAWAEKLTQLLENNERLVDMRLDAELVTSPAAGSESIPATSSALSSSPNLNI
jgi:translation initiation factor 3 subunit C